jgi:hypothetical protein
MRELATRRKRQGGFVQTPTPPAPEHTAGDSPATALARKGFRRFSAVEFLVVLLLWLATAPIVYDMKYGEQVEAALASVVMLSAVVAVGGRRRTLIAAIVLVTPACACKWLNRIRPDLVPPPAYAIAAIVFMVFVVVHLLRFILRAPKVNMEVLCAGISGYLMMGILWTLAYVLVAQIIPESFVFSTGQGRTMKGIEALYFSFVTLCTVGYGDIVPASHASRMLAVFEAMAGTFYVTILIARLVAMYSAEKRPDDAPGQGRS